MSYLQKIVYLTQNQYNTLAANGTVGSLTGINDDYLYVTSDPLNLTDLVGTLQVPHGGTGATSFVSGNLLVGNGQSALTTIVKTSANTANTVVERDANGNFSAGTITATLNGKIGTSTIGTVDKPIYLNAGTLTPIASVLETSVLRSSGDEYYAYDQGNRLAYYDEQNKVKPAQSITVEDGHLSIGRRSIDEDYLLYVSGNSYISDTAYVGTIKTAQIWVSPSAQIETVNFPSGYTFQAFGHSRFSNYMNLNVALELWQNNKASFRFLNDNNVFYLQDKNAADALTAYQTALSLTVNTGNIEISRGTVTVNNTTNSTTKTTGAITIAGGAGIGGQVNAEAFRINEQARFEYNSTDDSIDLIWG